jgi:hypothetical protein
MRNAHALPKHSLLRTLALHAAMVLFYARRINTHTCGYAAKVQISHLHVDCNHPT